MKISNTVNGELKEQIQTINDTVSKLQIFYDEQTEVMEAFEKKINFEATKQVDSMKNDLSDMKEERNKYKKELD